MTADFFVPALPRIYGERLNTYKNYSMDEPATDAIFERETPVTESAQSDSYTEERRAFEVARESGLYDYG